MEAPEATTGRTYLEIVMRKHVFFAVVLLSLSVLTPTAGAEPLTGEDDGTPKTLAELALESGSRAALLATCGIDGTSLRVNFEHRLDADDLNLADRSALRQSYHQAQTSAAATLVRSGVSSCADAYGLLRETLHDLAEPSEVPPPRGTRPDLSGAIS